MHEFCEVVLRARRIDCADEWGRWCATRGRCRFRYFQLQRLRGYAAPRFAVTEGQTAGMVAGMSSPSGATAVAVTKTLR